uniref:NADH-ubiquinone oxidoreductase chain 4 n=1 Tax=Haplorchis taichui TaxID=235153 RepID=A0A3G4YLE8_9TREM|nr:NADH dehydrogenase subunit 4 [Haplorchis taichui]
MGFKSFSWYSGLIGALSVSGLIILVEACAGLDSIWLSHSGVTAGVFCFDVISFYLILLSILLSLSLSFWVESMSYFSRFMIFLSVLGSLLCYCCVHVVWFWVFYEMSIVPLLVLLIVDSPYSERYVASWYLLGYVVFTSLPMLLCILYLSLLEGGFNMGCWGSSDSWVVTGSLIVLAFLFITKIPLPPFHVWLPIVHAEASSPVSVCLSGYIMKLGLLGVCRFCFFLLPDFIFSLAYTVICFLCSVLFFFSASRELDGKRWLAFLSLSHILVAMGCLSVGGWVLSGSAILYCMGHGLSAGVMFLFLWLMYDVVATRNLALLKSGISGSLLFRVLACCCLCTACSLPPTVQFFCEVSLMTDGAWSGGFFLLVFYAYVFMGGLMPLFLVGSLLSRHYDVSFHGGSAIGVKVYSLFYLIMWSFGLFLVC